MKNFKVIILAIFLMFSSLFASAQTTAVTATITDSDSIVWINANWSVQFVPAPNFPNLNSYTIGGVPITGATYVQYLDQNGTANSSGAISVTLLDNSQVFPGGSSWRFIVQSNTSAPATTFAPITVSGASQSLSTYLSAGAVAPRFPAINNAFGYADVEISIIPQPGGSYYNTGTSVPGQRIWNGSAWISAGGSGGTCGTDNIPCTNTTNTFTAAQTISSTLSPNVNNVYYVDGFTSTLYPGIGVAQTAWSSGTYPLCTAVSNGGNNYLAVGVTTGVTPGTNSAVWYQVPDANVPTQTYCAVYYTLAQALAAGSSYDLYFGDNTFTGPYVTNGSLVLQNGQSHVSLHGAGRGFNTQHTTIQAGSTFPTSTWMVTTPTYTGSTPYNLVVEGINFDANFLAYGCFQFYGEKIFRYEHLGCINWNPSSASARPMSVGSPSDSPGGYQGIINDVFIAGGTGATRATVTVALGSGSPVFTVSNGGTYKYNTGHVLFWGWATNGTSPVCSTTGTLTPTFTGSAGSYTLASIAASGFSGCSGTGYVYVQDITAAQYAVDISNVTDFTVDDLVVANAGYQYGILYNGVGASVMKHEHVYSQSQVEIVDSNENTHIGAELDDIAQNGASTGPNTTFLGTIVATPGALAPRAGVYEFGSSTGGNIINSTCPNTSTNAGPFYLAAGSNGPMPHGGNFSPFNVVNGKECDTLTTENSFISGLVVPGITSSQVVSAPNVSSAMTVASPVTAATYYVDNVNGSDSNNGTSQATPWKTIAHVNAATIASGAQVLFLSTDVWHEQLNASTGVKYSWYGPQRDCSISATLVAHCTQMPIIDGADVVTGWTLVTGSTYSSAYTSTASKGFVDSLYHQTTPLALQTSLGNVESTPGSIFSNGTLVYVNLLDGSNPTAHVIEVSGSRAYGINLSGNSTITVDGIEVIRAAKSGIVAGVAVSGNSITAQNNVIFNSGDSLGDTSQGYGAGNAEGSIFSFPAFDTVATGWNITGNWIGQSDFPDSVENFTVGGIELFAMSGPTILGNKVATIHGTAVQLSDESFGPCTAASVQNNELVNSEGNLWFIGCLNMVVVGNDVHNSFGNGVEIGGGNDSTDPNNNSPYLANNVIHDISPAYANGVYNGIDVNHATNGVATGNTIYRVASSSMTLEADSNPSSGWQVYGNTFDATGNTYIDGTACTSSNRCFTMYVRNTSLAGGLTMRGNTLVENAASGYLTRFGATSAGDTTHDLTQAQFDLQYSYYETPGTSPVSWAGLYKGYAVDTGAANAYVVTLGDSNYTGAVAGAFFYVKFANASSASGTLAINGGTARTIHGAAGAGTTSSSIVANTYYLCVDDGTNINISPVGGANQYQFFDDGFMVLFNGASNTKRFLFSAASITAGNTRTLTVPDASVTLAGINLAQTWSALQSFGSGLTTSGSRKGTFTCTAAGTITIANTLELATSDIIISLNTAGGTIATPPAMKTVTAGTGFTVLCSALDTSVYNYNILN